MRQNHRCAAPAINPTKNSSLFEVPYSFPGVKIINAGAPVRIVDVIINERAECTADQQLRNDADIVIALQMAMTFQGHPWNKMAIETLQLGEFTFVRNNCPGEILVAKIFTDQGTITFNW